VHRSATIKNRKKGTPNNTKNKYIMAFSGVRVTMCAVAIDALKKEYYLKMT
jgi:hypothetical protein